MNRFRFAFRQLLRTPGYALAFIVTLGLAIGVNTAIFSAVNGVLLEPLPYANSDRLVYVKHPARQAGVDHAGFSFTEIKDLRESVKALDAFVEYGDLTFNVVGENDPHRAVGGIVTSNYFDILGLRAQLGRTLGVQDDGTGAEPAMVLTHDYWQRVFGGDPAVLGRQLKLFVFGTARTARVVGVLRPGPLYTGSRRQDFFVNYASNDHYGGAAMLDERTHRMTDLFARLAPGQTVEAAQAELTTVSARLRQQYPDAYPAHFGYDIAVSGWRDALTSEARPMLILLVGAVGLVLALACANVANLTLARLVRRERELAVRAAMGASPRTLRLDMFADNLVLAVGGALLGLLFAFLSKNMLVQYASRYTARTAEISIDLRVLAFTAVVATGVALLLAWTPALPGLSGVRTTAAAAGSARGVVGLPRRQLQRALVVCQLALCFTLLVGAGLLVRTFVNLSNVDTGVDYQNVVAMDAPNATGMTLPQNRAFMEQLIERTQGYPGVRSIAYVSRVPFSPSNVVRIPVRIEGGVDGGVGSPEVAQTSVSPGYFETVGVAVIRGRQFMRADEDSAAERVAIVNESLSRYLFGTDDPLGRRFAQQQFNGQWGPWIRVVGISRNTRELGLSRAETHVIYRPAGQTFPGQSVIIRAAGDPAPAISHVTGLVREMDRERPVDNVTTLEALRSEDLAPPRLNATLFAAFGGLALVIATVGVFGVLAFAVSQRTREFGLRMALGAREMQVLGMVLKEGSIMAVIAVVLGLGGALLLSNFLRGLLFNVTPADIVTYVGVGAVLVSVALLAAYLPAKRATRADPADALRAE